MSLADRLESLEPRERRLLGVLGAVFAVMLLLSIPFGVSLLLSDETEAHDRLTSAIERIETEGDTIRERQEDHEALLARYETPAPALASFLDKAASASGLAIPEIKDLSPVSHGKRYEERSTSISLRKVGLLALVKFMERVSGGTEPISIAKLNIRKRGAEPDAYDVQMTVSAFHRLQTKPKDEPAEGKEGGEELEQEEEP
jgi:general secretion pathway protein M